MITEATEILEVTEAAKGAPPLLPGLPASEYLSGELWECSDQAELLYAQRKRFLAEIGFCLVTAADWTDYRTADRSSKRGYACRKGASAAGRWTAIARSAG